MDAAEPLSNSETEARVVGAGPTGTTMSAQAEVRALLRYGDGREEHVRARYVVGADGAHSAVRHTLGLPFLGDAYSQDFVLADLEINWAGDEDRLYFFLSHRGLLAVFPLAGS